MVGALSHGLAHTRNQQVFKQKDTKYTADVY